MSSDTNEFEFWLSLLSIEPIIGIAVPFLAGLLTAIFGQIFRERFSWRREQRTNDRWQLGNIQSFVFEKYHAKRIRDYRTEIEKETDRARLEDSEPKYELTLLLQQMGLGAYVGLLPLEPILSGNATRYFSDWVLVQGHINEVRDVNLIDTIPFQRRHAEWLACICFEWIVCQKFELTGDSKLKLEEFRTIYCDYAGVAKREQLLFSAESSLVNRETKNIVKFVRRKYRWWLRRQSLKRALSITN